MDWLQFFVGTATVFLHTAEGSLVCLAEERSGITLNCTVIKNSGTLIWSRRDGNSTRTMASCQQGRLCDMSYQSYTATVTNFSDSYWISFFTITSAGRIDQGSWTCNVDSWIVPACDIKVFTRPINVMCAQPQVQKDQVLVTCTGEKVYPDPLCHFSWFKEGKEETSLVGAVVNQSSSQQGNPSYFYPTCTWNIPVQSLGFGSHQFKVLVYPNVTGTNTDMDYGADSTLTSPVNITTPDVTFESCPVGQVKDGFVEEGTTASCTCREINNEFLLSNTSWSSSQGEQLIWGKQNSTLTFQAKKISQSFTCEADVLGRKSTSKIYVPQVAFGPNQVVVKVKINNTDKDVIDLCGKPQNVNIRMYCTVSDVNPDAIFQYFINGTELQGSPFRMFEISKSGRLSTECRTTNSKFETLSIWNTTFIEVTEPPNAPVIRIDQGTFSSDGSQMTVKEGIVQVSCQVEGGYPHASNLTLDCGGFNATLRSGDFVNVNITRKMNSQPCSCTASHISSCYVNNKVTSILNVMYPPVVTLFTIMGPINQEVYNNTDVTFSCQAVGNPNPDLFLQHDSYILKQIDGTSNASLKFSKSLKCQDTGVYICKAQSYGSAVTKSEEINVLCKQQLRASEYQHTVYTGRVSQRLDIYISVYGYPKPTLQLESSKLFEKSSYILTYLSSTPPDGVISLKFQTLSDAHFQQYNISITNTEGTLIYSFQIKADSTEDAVDVGAILGGVAAGTVVIILVIVIVLIVRKKGFLKKHVNQRNEDTHIHTVGSVKEDTAREGELTSLPKTQNKSGVNTGPNYENTVPDLDIEDVPPYSHYEELADVSPVSPDNSSDYVNKGFSDTQDSGAQYENTVSAL